MGNPVEAGSGAISFSYLAEIAVGATARVDLCRANDGRLLAVKRLHPHIAEDPGFATQFLDEVWMTASLKHPNVVEVAGWGNDDQGSYLAVELVQGVSLSRLMKTVFDTGEQFTERMVVFICSQLSAGLAAAHNLRSSEGELLNLVHRDLTPGNVLIGFNGDVKIADFGLAKAKLRLTKTLTGLAKGQPTYMAPEQAKALDIDKRADLFSLGISMFELFSGRRPWLGSTDYEMMQRTANDPPADLFQLRPKIDKELVAIVSRCLEKDPDQRFQSIEEVQARLDGWLGAHGYLEGSLDALARFVRRNAMRQMRWFERAVAGELAPNAPARVGRSLPPRVPSYANVTGVTDPPRAAREVSRDLRATRGAGPDARRSMPRIVDDATDVSDAIPRLAGSAGYPPVSQPVIRDLGGDAESDWGEEVPTLVQKSGSPMVGRRRTGLTPNGPAPALAPTKKVPTLVDEESDQRTTAVKEPIQKPPLVGRVSQKPAVPSVVDIADHDSEEMPTIPANAGIRASQPPLAPSPIGRGPASTRRPSSAPPGGSPLPGRVVSGAPSVPPVPHSVRSGSSFPPAPPPPSSQPNGGAAMARNAVEAVRAAVFAATAEHARVSSHGGVEEMSPAPQAMRRPPASESPRSDLLGQGPARPLTEDGLLAEADRLAIEAVRRAEEAKTAAQRADRKAFQAKLASDAAMVAAEAVRLAQTSGFAAAAQRLEDAHQIEQRMLSGTEGTSGASHSPIAGGPLQAAPIAQPVAQPPMPQQPHPQQFQRQNSAPMSIPPMSVPPPASLTTPRYAVDSGIYAQDGRPSYDPYAFQQRLKPSLLRLNAYTLVALAVAAFMLAFVVLWAVFG